MDWNENRERKSPFSTMTLFEPFRILSIFRITAYIPTEWVFIHWWCTEIAIGHNHYPLRYPFTRFIIHSQPQCMRYDIWRHSVSSGSSHFLWLSLHRILTLNESVNGMKLITFGFVHSLFLWISNFWKSPNHHILCRFTLFRSFAPIHWLWTRFLPL